MVFISGSTKNEWRQNTECGLDLIAQFLADPTQAPDSRCIGEMEMAWALTE